MSNGRLCSLFIGPSNSGKSATPENGHCSLWFIAVHVFISRRDLFDLPFSLIAQPLEATIQEHLIFAWRPAVLQDAGPCASGAESRARLRTGAEAPRAWTGEEEAARQKARELRQQAVDKAQAALGKAEQGRAKRAAAIQAKIEALEKRSQVKKPVGRERRVGERLKSNR
jgi:hypothetical protein